MEHALSEFYGFDATIYDGAEMIGHLRNPVVSLGASGIPEFRADAIRVRSGKTIPKIFGLLFVSNDIELHVPCCAFIGDRIVACEDANRNYLTVIQPARLHAIPTWIVTVTTAMPSYMIAADGKSITCRRCGLTSHNANDVRERYCGRCRLFHDDAAAQRHPGPGSS